MNKSASNKDLDKTMSFILNHKSLSNKDIDELTSTSKSRNALTVLKAMKAIDYNISISGNYYNSESSTMASYTFTERNSNELDSGKDS